MAIYIVPTPRHNYIGHTESFNATTSDLAFGLAPHLDLLAQTCLAYIYQAGTHENQLGYILSSTPSASVNGLRLFISNATNTFSFGTHSTTSAGNPQRTIGSAVTLTNKWAHIGVTWPGSLTASTIQLYLALEGAPIEEVSSYGLTTNGTGAVSITGNNFHIGNRENTDRTFNGTIAYVARWNRVLPLVELRYAQQYGPLSVPDGLMLCWSSGQDWSPSRAIATQTAVMLNGRAPTNNSLGYTWREPRLSMFNITEAAVRPNYLTLLGVR